MQRCRYFNTLVLIASSPLRDFQLKKYTIGFGKQGRQGEQGKQGRKNTMIIFALTH